MGRFIRAMILLGLVILFAVMMGMRSRPVDIVIDEKDEPAKQGISVNEIREDGVLVEIHLHYSHIQGVKRFEKDPGWCILLIHPEVAPLLKATEYSVEGNGKEIYQQLRKAVDEKNDTLLIYKIKKDKPKEDNTA